MDEVPNRIFWTESAAWRAPSWTRSFQEGGAFRASPKRGFPTPGIDLWELNSAERRWSPPRYPESLFWRRDAAFSAICDAMRWALAMYVVGSASGIELPKPSMRPRCGG